MPVADHQASTHTDRYIYILLILLVTMKQRGVNMDIEIVAVGEAALQEEHNRNVKLKEMYGLQRVDRIRELEVLEAEQDKSASDLLAEC